MTLSRFCRTFVPAVLILTACSDGSGPDTPQPKLEALPRQLSAGEQKLIAGNNTFAFDLLKAVNRDQQGNNVFVSPLSASMALGMTMNGANGATFSAMRTALRLDNASQDEINQGYKSLVDLLRGLDKTTDFRIANSIWYEKKFPFNSSFMDQGKQYFDARVEALDFSNQSSSLASINGWVNEATNKKIPKILNDIDPDEKMFLINAIYFKGAWVDRFDKSQTVDGTFHSIGGDTKAPLMSRDGDVTFSQTPDFTVVDMPYGNSAFTMTVIMPRAGLDVNSAVASMTAQQWQALTSAMTQGKRPLVFPKFKLEWEKNLNADLSALGMSNWVFDNADFTRMSPQGDKLVISRVIQKTFVDVNEEGTEAAAATSVGIIPTSAPAPVVINRPFVFAIRERLSGTIIFMGKIVRLPA